MQVNKDVSPNQCCQLCDFLARFSDFSDPLGDFISKKASSDKFSDLFRSFYIVIHMLLRVIAVHGSSTAAPRFLPAPLVRLRRRQTTAQVAASVWGPAGAGRSGHDGCSLCGFETR